MMNTQQEWEEKRFEGLVEYERGIAVARNGVPVYGWRCREVGIDDFMSTSAIAKRFGVNKQTVKTSMLHGRPPWISYAAKLIVDGKESAPRELRGKWLTNSEISVYLDVGQRWVTENSPDYYFRWREPDRNKQKISRISPASRTKLKPVTHGIPHLNVFTSLPRVV